MTTEHLPLRPVLVEELAKSLFMVSQWGLLADSPEQLNIREGFWDKLDEVPGKEYFRRLATTALDGLFRLTAVAPNVTRET